jgi:serine/threonine protein kinase
MADVYLARRRAAGVEKWLVVKRMRPETSGDPRFLDLFVREARLSMSLVHQNIVPVFDFGKIDDQVFLAMERVEGKDLGSSLARSANKRLPPLLAAFIAAECCQALDYAHQRKGPDGIALGIVHRDVTPRNVLLSWSGEVKLTDFGIAALAGDATSRLLGTPQYMAPEQARSEPIDPRADLYAIGLVLREAVVGKRPRPGTDRESILHAARRGELLPWAPTQELAAGSGDHTHAMDPRNALPPALVAIIDRATSSAACDRYPDARSMLEEIDSFIVGERAAHKAESPARQLAAWLSQVWEGARDDIEPAAAVEASHLLSFIDDGAFDMLGTGTARSIAQTAAEDVPVVPAAGAPSTQPRRPPSGAIAIPPRPGEPANRSTRVSSSQATVASGSFHTVDDRKSGGRPITKATGSRLRPRQIAPLASIVVVAVVVGATVFVATNNYRDRDHPEVMTPVDATRQEPRPRDLRHPDPGPPGGPRPSSGPSAHASATPPGPGPRAVAKLAAPPTDHPGAGRPSPGRPALDRRGERPGFGHPGSDAVQPDAAPGSDGAVAADDDPPPPPRTCLVRINLTPWAYYTADGDTTRHETPGTIELTPGPHRLHVWNPELHIARDITINVPADRDTMNYSEPLQPAALPSDAGRP